jgi:ParE toxin of type II toxin-antitoxin system, parDE
MKNMVFKIRILKLAELEINESIDFYEARSIGLGKRFFVYLKSYYQILKTNPELFEIKKQPFYRELPMVKFPFVIIYEIFDQDVLIHSVFHTSRNPLEKP